MLDEIRMASEDQNLIRIDEAGEPLRGGVFEATSLRTQVEDRSEIRIGFDLIEKRSERVLIEEQQCVHVLCEKGRRTVREPSEALGLDHRGVPVRVLPHRAA